MTPIDTHHDSLGIYFDFLEESGNDTSELRIDLISSNSVHWCYEFPFVFSMVGDDDGSNYVGVDDYVANSVGITVFKEVGRFDSSSGDSIGNFVACVGGGGGSVVACVGVGSHG